MRLDNTPYIPPVFESAEDERAYWHSRTPLERLRHTEYLRRVKYGPSAIAPMNKRTFEIVRLDEDGNEIEEPSTPEGPERLLPERL